MLRRALPALIAALAVLAGLAALLAHPTEGVPQRTAAYVVVAGVPGLRWEDLNPDTTPTLWRMAERGAIGSLSVRSARQPTCPVDGWLTLGAGNYAAWDGTPVTAGCPRTDVRIDRPDGIGANLPDQQSAVRHNQDKLPWNAVPGALAESVRCTVAVGPGAAVAAARPFGRVDRYEPRPPPDLADLLASCVLSIVDLGTISGDDAAARTAAVRRADAALARILAARPERSVVVVAGLADTDLNSRLHVAIADGPGWEGGWLTSASTGRDGYLQLVDLAPTALAVIGRPPPERLFVGAPAIRGGDRPADLVAAINGPADADREAKAQRSVATWFFGLLAAAVAVLAGAVVPLLRRARAHPGEPEHGRRIRAVVEVLLVATALAIPAALVADIVPWWRGTHAGLYFGAVTALALAVATAGVRFARPYGRTLGPMSMVAGLAALVVGADVVTGARLQLNGVTGYSALEGGRYAGLGTIGLGVFIAGILLSAGCLAQRTRRRWRPAVMVVVGTVAIVLVGSPYFGADAAGAIAMTAGVCLATAISAGGWLTLGRLAWATLAGFVLAAGLALLDLRRPEPNRSGLSGFLAALGDGTSGAAVHRAAAANVDALAGSSLTVLAVVAAVLAWFALLRPWGGLRRLFGIYPAVRAAMAGAIVAALIGGLLGGSALNVAGAAAALVVPMAMLAALRVLDHAAERTVPVRRAAPFDEAPADALRGQPAAASPLAGGRGTPPGTDAGGGTPAGTEAGGIPAGTDAGGGTATATAGAPSAGPTQPA
jgi:hypothetical protein